MSIFSGRGRSFTIRQQSTAWTYALAADPDLLAEAEIEGKRAGKGDPPQVNDTPSFLELVRRTFVAANQDSATRARNAWGVTLAHLRSAERDDDQASITQHREDLQRHLDEYDGRRARQEDIYETVEKAFLSEALPRWRKKKQDWVPTSFEIEDLLEETKRQTAALQKADGLSTAHVQGGEDE